MNTKNKEFYSSPAMDVIKCVPGEALAASTPSTDLSVIIDPVDEDLW